MVILDYVQDVASYTLVIGVQIQILFAIVATDLVI